MKHNIMRRLASFGCRITVVPANMPAAEVLAMSPDGILFSNGGARQIARSHNVDTHFDPGLLS